MAGPVNSSVFRYAVLCAGFSYVLAESGLGLRERIKRPEIGGRIRTISDSRPEAAYCLKARAPKAPVMNPSRDTVEVLEQPWRKMGMGAGVGTEV